jgi:exo-1,4-beta-D-glucosaminidase
MNTRAFFVLLLLSVFLLSNGFAQKTVGASIVLRDDWVIQSSATVKENGELISVCGYTAKDWYPTTMPSTVLATLVANKVYADPYYGNNYFELPGIRRWDKPEGNPFTSAWWYRTEFNVPESYDGKHIWLKFHSVNYRANLWVNGQKVADSTQIEGAYRLFDFDISKYIKVGQENCLALEIFPPKDFDLTISWVDWNPTPPDKNMGIWYDVTLSESGAVAIDHPSVKTKLNLPSTDKANLTVVAEVKNAESIPIKGILKGTIENIAFAKEVHLNANETMEVTFTPDEFSQLIVKNPRLWWPHTVGPQNLYNLNLSFEIGGKVSDTRKTRFGIREISSWMNNFDSLHTKVFQINGKNIVIRGGGYVEDLMLRPSNERVDADLNYLKFMGLNAIRMEAPRGSDYVFERCDEEGILVMVGWCCGYPFESWKDWTPHTADIAEKSWRDQIVNLRAHPSVFTWLYGSDNFPPEEIERRYINVIKQYDGARPYSSSATQEPSKLDGNTGFWMGPWPKVYGYLPPSYWYTKFEFNTECGPNGEQLPPIETSKKVMPEKDLWPISSSWDLRLRKDFYPYAREALISRYGKPESLEDYCSKSQILQMEATKAMFEAYAGNKYKSSGVIYWMFNSAWPKFYWQLYDYFLMPNGAFYGAKKACEPLHIQYNYMENAIQVVNSFYEDFKGLKVTAKVFDFNAKEIFTKEITTDIKADESKILFKPGISTGLTDIYFLKLNLTDRTGKEISSNFYWLSAKGDEIADFTGLAKLPSVEVTAKPGSISNEKGKLKLVIEFSNPSSNIAFGLNPKLLSVSTKEPILPIFWQDNYFALLPGEKRTVEMQVNALLVTENKILFKLDGWNLKIVHEEELIMP